MAKSKSKKSVKNVKKVNKRDKNSSLYAIIAVLALAVIGLSVAYAALQTELNISINRVTQNALDWEVKFIDPDGAAPYTVSGVTGAEASSLTGLSCGTATISSDGRVVTVDSATLSKPNDRCYWTLTIINSGDINAKLTQINSIEPNSISCTDNTGGSTTTGSITCGNIKYMLTNTSAADSTLFGNSTVTIAGGADATKNVYLQAVYVGESVSGSAVTHTGVGFELIFGQA